MGLQVFKKAPRWTDDEQELHLVGKKGWVSSQRRMLTLEVTTMCGAKYAVAKGDTYREYAKEIHRKRLCDRCVSVVKLRRQHATQASQTATDSSVRE